MADRRDRYPTDLSDAEWAVLEPLLPPPARSGAPTTGSARSLEAG